MCRDTQADPYECDAAILCSSYPADTAQFSCLSRKLCLQFDDTENTQSERSFSMEQARLIADFVRDLDAHARLCVCCDSGESRSTAIAAALHRKFGMDEMVIWGNPHYHPNTLVYRRMCEALGITVTPEMVHERKRISEEALARAIRAARDGETE